MKPIRSRTDLLALVAQHAPSKACARAISENRAHVLGGFTPVEGLPCFIVRVTSKHERTWIIAVDVDEPHHRYRFRFIDEIPWNNWDGTSGGERLIDGDLPVAYAYERMQARRKRGTAATAKAPAEED
jgi:hypothetical protein